MAFTLCDDGSNLVFGWLRPGSSAPANFQLSLLNSSPTNNFTDKNNSKDYYGGNTTWTANSYPCSAMVEGVTSAFNNGGIPFSNFLSAGVTNTPSQTTVRMTPITITYSGGQMDEIEGFIINNPNDTNTSPNNDVLFSGKFSSPVIMSKPQDQLIVSVNINFINTSQPQ